MLSSISTVFGRLLLKHIHAFVDMKNCIQHTQFDFRPFHTTHQLVSATSQIKTGIVQKQSTDMILFDGEMFDTILHAGLLHKISNPNFPTYLLIIIQSFINNRRTIDRICFCFSFSFSLTFHFLSFLNCLWYLLFYC